MDSTPKDTWPFDQPRNFAAFTMRQVLEGTEPILVVGHDADDLGWQFIGSSDPSVPDARIVALEEMVNFDPSVLEVADLPPGWQAVRNGPGLVWKRRPRRPSHRLGLRVPDAPRASSISLGLYNATAFVRLRACERTFRSGQPQTGQTSLLVFNSCWFRQ